MRVQIHPLATKVHLHVWKASYPVIFPFMYYILSVSGKVGMICRSIVIFKCLRSIIYYVCIYITRAMLRDHLNVMYHTQFPQIVHKVGPFSSCHGHTPINSGHVNAMGTPTADLKIFVHCRQKMCKKSAKILSPASLTNLYRAFCISELQKFSRELYMGFHTHVLFLLLCIHIIHTIFP